MHFTAEGVSHSNLANDPETEQNNPIQRRSSSHQVSRGKISPFSIPGTSYKSSCSISRRRFQSRSDREAGLSWSLEEIGSYVFIIYKHKEQMQKIIKSLCKAIYKDVSFGSIFYIGLEIANIC